MMDSSNLNLDLHHQEDYFHGSSSSITALPFHFVGRNHDSWNQDLPLNSADHNFIQNANGIGSAPKDFMRLSHDMPMVQDLGYQWGDQEGSGYLMNHSSHQELLPKNIKEELSESFAKLSGINLQNYHLIMPRNDDEHKVNGLPPPAADVGFDPMIMSSMGSFGRGSFSMVLPTTNISDLDPLPSSSSYSNTLGMDVQALDLLASGRFGRTLCQPTMDNMALLREDLAYGLGQLQEPAQQATQIKISHTISGVSNQQSHKANGDSLEYKASQSVAKKPRFESRASFTPFKVRKEKLGDRIAALQQLVAPFGKTDTASVLMEAIGYIKFLQDQVETLSVPYMRSSNTKKTRTSGEASSDEREEPKLDLRSRGLCLVPLSCTSYVTNENGGVWSPPNYRGGT